MVSNNKQQKWQQISIDVLREKYAKGDEQNLDGEQMVVAIRNRVARALAKHDHDPVKAESDFLDAMISGFIPAGRVNSAAGTDIKNATLINCFVQGIGDSITGIDDGKPGIYQALQEAAETLRRGGGVGYNFSSIRPVGAKVKGTASHASGPVSYMTVFDRSCSTVESAGVRRGAQMAVLNASHPDIFDFISAKQTSGTLNNFNISVGVSDAFMSALKNQQPFELVHKAEPSDDLIKGGAFQREDGLWVYRTIDPAELWDRIMQNTYNAAEPGVLFLDTIRKNNNLQYCEKIEATNPCGEQNIPDYGCCCLGSVNLTAFVKKPFTDNAQFDFNRFAEVVAVGIRMLDCVLDESAWPLPQQQKESEDKRRVGLGYTGLGDALVMMQVRYDSQEGRNIAAQITRVMRDAAYEQSIELAKEKGPFLKFDAEQYLSSEMAKRLPTDIRNKIREHGIRNSHLLSIAPTGTISLALADNCSGGLEPAFSWVYTRKKREPDGSTSEYIVEDHAYRVYRELGGDTDNLPDYFRSALDISADSHLKMQAAVQPYICSSISKTVNIPSDYPYDRFKALYTDAYHAGLKGLTTYRPNDILGSVLSVGTEKEQPEEIDPDRKLRITDTPDVALASLRWPKRPSTPKGNPGVTYMLEDASKGISFAVFIGHLIDGDAPFEVWVNGAEAPRGLAALAKNLSMDMRASDQQWLKNKVDSLIKTSGQQIDVAMPPTGKIEVLPSSVAALAKLIKLRVEDMGGFESGDTNTPLVDAMFSLKEPKSSTAGTLSWACDVLNHSTGDDLVVFVKECELPNGQHRPFSIWLSGTYPREFDGLAKSLSLDMRVLDPGWIGKKLRSLKDYPEPQGDFFALVPGSDKQASQPSTVAYIARLLIHRYHLLGILDAEGYPIEEMGLLERFDNEVHTPLSSHVVAGKPCPECGTAAIVKRDGCEFCSACGYIGSCG